MIARDRLRGLIVSVQAEASSLLNAPDAIALLSRTALTSGAVAVRIEGLARMGAVRRATAAPMIGLVKRFYEGFEPYITAASRELAECVAAGADVIAFDATDRPRPDGRSIAEVIAAIHAYDRLAMADCSSASDMAAAHAAGADIVSTTLCGYTAATRGTNLPALTLVKEAPRGAFVVCEGGVVLPADVRAARLAGAAAVVVGTALTNLDVRVRAFATEVLADDAQSV